MAAAATIGLSSMPENRYRTPAAQRHAEGVVEEREEQALLDLDLRHRRAARRQARTMPGRSSFTRVTPALPIATAVPVPITIAACARARASLMPSPSSATRPGAAGSRVNRPRLAASCRRAVIGMVMSESIRLVAIGIVPGLAAVPRADQFVQTVVYGLSPVDSLTSAGAARLECESGRGLAAAVAIDRHGASCTTRGPVFDGVAANSGSLPDEPVAEIVQCGEPSFQQPTDTPRST